MGSGSAGSTPAGRYLIRRRKQGVLAFDVLTVGAVYCAVLYLRFDGNIPAKVRHNFLYTLPLIVGLHLAANAWFRLYRQIWASASIGEARRVLAAGAAASAALSVARLLGIVVLPLSIVVLGGALATVALGAVRFQARLLDRGRLPRSEFCSRVGIIGAGSAGADLIRQMQRHPHDGLMPVAVFDDDTTKHGLAVAGVPVVGSVESIAVKASLLGLQQLVIAVPTAGAELARRVVPLAEAQGLTVKVLPGVGELLGSSPTVRDVRAVRIEDLLGRSSVETDMAGVASIIQGRTVLITGAGGSIGSELVRQVAARSPAALIAVDHDETHLYDVAALLGHPIEQVLADVRDRQNLIEIFRRYRPDLVFHAAAHKHVPVLEAFAAEAFRTNVLGTANVVDAAVASGVERLVFISTDKAVRPSSVMGASKWLGEQIVLSGGPQGGRFAAVRFGNVLGSRGSVVPLFARQIEAGGPVTVTDPRMDRFFMTVEEAVQLVLQAAAFAEGGEIFMLEMGESVNILDLAKRMIRLSGRTPGTDVPVRIVGRRPGEKLTEELQSPAERAHPTAHPGIVRLEPSPVDQEQLREQLVLLGGLASDADHDAVSTRMLRLAHEVAPPRRRRSEVDLVVLEAAQARSVSETREHIA